MADQSRPVPRAEIVEYEAKYGRHFHDITIAWLEELFEVEPFDRILLNDPQEHILKQGGHIFFALVEGEVVGTCALLKQTDKKYELAKMGVKMPYRGHGVGRLLAKAAIAKARSLKADTLVLATSRRLEAANHLYHSLGFQEVSRSVIGPLAYKRESIVFALEL